MSGFILLKDAWWFHVPLKINGNTSSGPDEILVFTYILTHACFHWFSFRSAKPRLFPKLCTRFVLCLTPSFSCQSLLKCHLLRGPPWPGCEEHFYFVQEVPWPFVRLFVKAAALSVSAWLISFLFWFVLFKCVSVIQCLLQRLAR